MSSFVSESFRHTGFVGGGVGVVGVLGSGFAVVVGSVFAGSGAEPGAGVFVSGVEAAGGVAFVTLLSSPPLGSGPRTSEGSAPAHPVTSMSTAVPNEDETRRSMVDETAWLVP
jgi:hypothetical protein